MAPPAATGGGAERRAVRARLGAAVIDLVLERGYERFTVEDLIGRAKVRRSEFDREFSGKEDCVLAVIDAETERFKGLVYGAYGRESSWRDGLRAAAYATARFVRENPRYTLFSTTMMNGATEFARARRDMAVQMISELIDAGRYELDDPSSISNDTALAVVGGIYELLQKELARGRGTGRAEDYVPQLMYIAVRPYLGHAEALKELSIPAPEAAR
jgi:AcrR family transcriptional regulator